MLETKVDRLDIVVDSIYQAGQKTAAQVARNSLVFGVLGAFGGAFLPTLLRLVLP